MTRAELRYPIAIEPGGEGHAFGVVVPDLPGCFSAGGTLDEAIANAKEAIELWLATRVSDGGTIPASGSIDKHQANPEFAGWVWAVVDMDHHTYRINWSAEDRQYVGLCVEFPSLSWQADTPEAALKGIREIVSEVASDLAG